MNRKTTFLIAFFAIAAFSAAQGPIKRAKHPAISPDGTQVIFSWQGDLWSVSSGGGAATRLTVHPADDVMPKFAPGGDRIVFASNRYGSYDLFSIKPDGSDLKRLTFESGTEYPNAMSPDGRWIYGYTTNFGRIDVFKVASGGGDIVRLTEHPFELEYYASISPDGKKVAYTRGGSPGSWRNPHDGGPNNGEIWVGDNGTPITNNKNLTNNDKMDLWPMYAADGSITFVSNRSGWPNLWRMNGDGGGAKQLTRFTDGTMRMPTISKKGDRVAFEFESDLYVYDADKGGSTKLDISVPQDQRTNPVADLSLTTGVSDYAVSPDGKRTALVVRGEIFLIPERGGTTRRLTKSPAVDFQPVWLDNKTILFVTGRNTKREFMTVDLDGNEKVFLADAQDVVQPRLSPDGKTLAFHRGQGEICVMPASGGAAKVIATGGFGDALRGNISFSWSPDSKWLVVDEPNSHGSNVVLRSVEGGKSIRIARTARGAQSVPQFLPNGKGVFFISEEYPDEADLYIVDLVPADITFSEDDLDKIDASRPTGSKAASVEVYEPGIDDRMRRLTRSGAALPVASPDSRSIWALIDGQLNAISVTSGAATPVAAVVGPAVNGKVGAGGSKLYFVSAGKLNALSIAQGTVAPVNFNAAFSVNLRDEEKALFDEIWWAFDRMYYREDHNEKGWDKLKTKFAAIVPHAFDRADFYAMMGEMMEEIDSSHLGATAPASAPAETNDSTAFLGVEWDWNVLASRGAYVVGKVYDGTPAAHPQSMLKTGDRIVSVDGVEPGSSNPMAALLNKKSGKKVQLKVERNGQTMNVDIKPADASARGNVLYENYVAWQRAEVERLSKGALTYIHIQAMDETSYQRFLREIRTYADGKKGVLLDVRFNGGGSTAQKILGVLVKQPWLIRTSRSDPAYKVSENIYRGDSLELPTALLTNQHSFSNAEIMSEGFRRLKCGPIIGEPTAGGVIGTSQMSFWDGGSIRIPAAGAYTIDGVNLERNGRPVDFLVNFDPNAWLAGRDTQLEKAVEELMKIVNARK
ncbi:MAG: PDZ domain-containing protein [Fimbriimonadaceae bacterium]|nr:PDZ domain-containing protein [Fimbriimonadaceae bacterium]